MKYRAASKLLAMALCASSFSVPASAFTGREVMEVFSQKERSVYFAGLADMAAFDQAVLGNTDRADCIADWFYGDDLGNTTVVQIESAAGQFPEQQVYRIVSALIKRACPLQE